MLDEVIATELAHSSGDGLPDRALDLNLVNSTIRLIGWDEEGIER